jgi:predicted house-cleaning noncanonical NTP pyrophosphatase (MazG superfamily)
MPRFVLKKLVRDKIVEYQQGRGQKPDFRTLSDDEYLVEISKKIAEEANELASASKDKLVEELADVQQAIDDLMEREGIDRSSVLAAQEAKNERNGAFKNGHYIDTLELDDDDEWVEYYRKEPGRFPEVD